MRKRVSNSKGRTQARFGRIRIGWKQQNTINQLGRAAEALSMKEATAEIKAKAKKLAKALKKFLPIRNERKRVTQARGR